MLRTSTAAPTLSSTTSLFVSIRASFAPEPRLAPGSPLYNLLAEPEGDNSPLALFDRLFNGDFKAKSCALIQDLLHLRKLCKWIIHYMHSRQGAAERVLEGMDPQDASVPLVQPHEWPIQDPPAFALSLLTDKAACQVHELEDLSSVDRLFAGNRRTHTPQMLQQPAMEKPAVKAAKPDSGVHRGEPVVVQAYRPPHLRQKDSKEKIVAPEGCKASHECDTRFWASAKGANKEGKLGSATPARWKASWRSSPTGYTDTVDEKGTDFGSIEVQSVASTCTSLGSETASSSLAPPQCVDGTQPGGVNEEFHQPEGELQLLLDLLEFGPQ